MKSSVITKNSLIALILLAVLVTANILIFFLPTMQTTAEKDLSKFPELTDVNVNNETVYDDGSNRLALYYPEMSLSNSVPTVGALYLSSALYNNGLAPHVLSVFDSYTGIYVSISDLSCLLSSDYKFTFFLGGYSYDDYINGRGLFGSFDIYCLSYLDFHSKGDYLYRVIIVPNFDEDHELTYTVKVLLVLNVTTSPSKVELLSVDNIPSGNREYGEFGFVTLDLSAIFSGESGYDYHIQNFEFDHFTYRVSPCFDLFGLSSAFPELYCLSAPPIHMRLIDDCITSNHLEYFDYLSEGYEDIDHKIVESYRTGREEGYKQGYYNGIAVRSSIEGFFPSVFQGVGSFIKTILDFEVFGISILKVVGVIGLLILLFMFIRLLR